MYKSLQALIILSLIFIVQIAQSNPDAKTLASTLEIYAFPKSGQDSQQQSQDEAECYSWASNNTGSDPFELQKQEVAVQQAGEQAKKDANNVGRGAGAKGAVKGAALGVVVDDSRTGAEKGAVAGAVVARRQGRKARKNAKKQAEKDMQAQQSALVEQGVKFKKAFSTCLEAKEYMVKY